VLGITLPVALLVAFAISQVANVVTTVYLHRAMAHRSLTLRPAAAFAMRFVVWLTTGIETREWVAVHRKHHVFTDQPEDPHSPVQRGWGKVLTLNVRYYRLAAKQPGVVETYARDLRPDRWERALFSRGVLGVGVGLVLLALLFGPLWAVIIGAAHFVIYIGLSGAVNGLGHHFGRRPHENTATNLRWLALLTAGEGMHNDHHEYPRSPRFGDSWWDLGGKLAGALARLRLATLHESSRRLRQASIDELGNLRHPISTS
jgi:stearoyl-CoA desaturase (delta-9 desaturase)